MPPAVILLQLVIVYVPGPRLGHMEEAQIGCFRGWPSGVPIMLVIPEKSARPPGFRKGMRRRTGAIFLCPRLPRP